MEKSPPLAEDPALIIGFDTEPLPQVNPANALTQRVHDSLVSVAGGHASLSIAFRYFSIRHHNMFVIKDALCYGLGKRVVSATRNIPVTVRSGV